MFTPAAAPSDTCITPVTDATMSLPIDLSDWIMGLNSEAQN